MLLLVLTYRFDVVLQIPTQADTRDFYVTVVFWKNVAFIQVIFHYSIQGNIFDVIVIDLLWG